MSPLLIYQTSKLELLPLFDKLADAGVTGSFGVDRYFAGPPVFTFFLFTRFTVPFSGFSICTLFTLTIAVMSFAKTAASAISLFPFLIGG
jgi:hypothetical protein